jgi:hypothetical protein
VYELLKLKSAITALVIGYWLSFQKVPISIPTEDINFEVLLLLNGTRGSVVG